MYESSFSDKGIVQPKCQPPKLLPRAMSPINLENGIGNNLSFEYFDLFDLYLLQT